MSIEVREGETLEQAIKRTAKEMTAHSEANAADMIDPLAHYPSEFKKAKPKRAKGKGGSKNRQTNQDPTPPVDEPIYSAVHLYQRPGEPAGVVEANARRERGMHGPSVLVFKHLHQPGAGCNDSCREKVASA